VFLPGTRFFDAAANRQAFDPAQPDGLVAVAPKIADFLLANKLIDGRAEVRKALDPSLLEAALAK
jgi:NitT/TauT family transport system substrate-binding protein